MLKKHQLYLIDWCMNQKIYCMYLYSFDNYDLFEERNESQRHIGYRISLHQKYNYKKTDLSLNNQYINEINKFSSLFQILKHLEVTHRIIEIYSSKKSIQGYIIDLSEKYLLLQMIDLDAIKNGIMLIPINYIDSVFWDNESGNRLERIVAYSKTDIGIDAAIASFLERGVLCEIYHSGFQTFILGKCIKVLDDYLLIESINMQDKAEGFVLIHKGLIDFICLDTKYIDTYHTPNVLSISITNLLDFFNYIIYEGIQFNLTTERKKIYTSCSLLSFDNEKIVINRKNKRKTFSINEIDIFDACEK